ncbi:exonuclease domain-containing protein [Marinobacterium sp. YM272]|uniref:3'-5' exonuclease n=1 Tax=Marinobacterium sp. YM272 TaxID=3421654 RepID=UPI003D7FDA95
MAPRQRLLGYWMLATGALAAAGVFGAIWLHTRLIPDTTTSAVIWLLAATPATLSLVVGLLLESRLLRPLRQFQVLIARLTASPDAAGDFPLDGWLASAQADFDHLRLGWRNDRELMRHAREEGARHADQIRQELEAVLDVLEIPLLICDDHQRILLFNPCAERMFRDRQPLGLGRRLGQVIPHASLGEALRQLPEDGSPRQLLLPDQAHWLRCEIRRLGGKHGEALILLRDTTELLTSEQSWRRKLAAQLPRLRAHAGNLSSAAQALMQADCNAPVSARFGKMIEEENQTLAANIDGLSRLLETEPLKHARLDEIWSNDLLGALADSLGGTPAELTPTGIPLWLRADGPTLLALLHLLLTRLADATGSHQFYAEPLLGNRRVYLDLSWQGPAVNESQLAGWRDLTLFDEPLSPRVGDVLEMHETDLWNIPREMEGESCLRLPLPASLRGLEPRQARQAATADRPEYHDFTIADLPAPDQDLANIPLNQLEMVVFDTETTGLNLRAGDRIISIAACRIVNGRLLAQDYFDQKVNPGRPIPAESTAIHGLIDSDVEHSPPIAVILPRFRQYLGQGVLVAHNAAFDLLAVRLPGAEAGIEFDRPVLDTLLLSRALDPTLEGHGLDALSERFDLHFPPGTRHTALGDARVTAELLLALLPRLAARGVETLGDALALQRRIEQGGEA